MAKKYHKSQIDIQSKKQQTTPLWELVLLFWMGATLGLMILALFGYLSFEGAYQNRIYPGISIANITFGGKTKTDVIKYFENRNLDFANLSITFINSNSVATTSAKNLDLGYNSKLLAEQAYLLGRSGRLFSDLVLKYNSLRSGIKLDTSLALNDQKLDELLNNIAKQIDLQPIDALFKMSAGRVVAFRTSHNGRVVNILQTKQRLADKLAGFKNSFFTTKNIAIPLVVETLYPKVNTEQANDLGISELLASGTSTFFHSIPNRIYNIDLASSRINGVVIPPQAVFSFNETVGDISGITGYRQAYIIKDGKTILGDGGGVCQVSTTLFRAALHAGLPITERWAHSYRVGYYEQDEPPGLDATVFAPANDLKIKNDTTSNILIQTKIDRENYRLTFELYGKRDERVVTISKPKLWGQSSPPPDLFQDDPTLEKDVLKQVDFSAPGAKASFDYTVTKSQQVLFQKTFYSDYRPWQAIYLRGTKE